MIEFENIVPIIAQILGIFGMLIIIPSFQCKKNSTFFIMQGTGGFMFFLNFMLIGAYGGAFFNLCNLIKGLLFAKDTKRLWKLIVVEACYVSCFVFSIFLDPTPTQIILVAIPCAALLANSVFMWLGNSKHIRYSQITFLSPAWIIHNIFNFSLGGLICETFNMISSLIYLIRMKKEKTEEK